MCWSISRLESGIQACFEWPTGILNSGGDMKVRFPSCSLERLHARSAINPTQAKRSVGSSVGASHSEAQHREPRSEAAVGKINRTAMDACVAVHHITKHKEKQKEA